MKQHKRRYWQALFLLLVFALNTVVGLACSFVPVFHSFHHHQKKQHRHAHGKAHTHSHAGHHHSKEPHSSDNDCCASYTAKMEKLDKSISRGIEAPVPADASFLKPLLIFWQPHSSPLLTAAAQLHLTRWRQPQTIPNLRIALQSFQI